MKNSKSVNMSKKAKKSTEETKIELEEVKSSPEELNIDDSFRLTDLYFKQKYILYSHLYNSFDKMIDEDVKNMLKYGDNTFFEKATENEIIKYKFRYDNVSIIPPNVDDHEPMFPYEARLRNLTYSLKVVATVSQIQERTNIATGNITKRIVGNAEDNIPLMTIPVMLRSKYCNLNLEKDQTFIYVKENLAIIMLKFQILIIKSGKDLMLVQSMINYQV